MFTSIKTSKSNKELVTNLTQKLSLRAENTIARLALALSIAENRYMDLDQIQDSQGKEYSTKVLFGDYLYIYVSMICVHYNIYKTDKDIGKYIKMHIDDGILLIHKEIEKKSSVDILDFIIKKIENGVSKVLSEIN